MTFKRTLCALLAASMLTTGLVSTASVATAAEIESEVSLADLATQNTGNNYGLLDSIQEGNILHCFCWKYNDIKDMLPQIAESGFTAVQTSPPQATSGTGSWWWFYQPQGFYIGTSAMGTKQDYQNLCTEAEKYGIKVVADIVANHLAGDHSNIQDDLKDSQYWHADIGDATDGDRWRVTHGKIGMPDLNTEHSYVQQCVYNYVQELKGVGVDAIRWDAAKHIGLPSEGDNFWPAVTKDSSLWYYGEILNNPGISNEDPNALNIMKEYTTYMTVTDSSYGMTLRNAFNSGTVTPYYGNYVAMNGGNGLANNKVLYWGESHDTWSNNNDWGYSNTMSQNVIDRAYAVAASRNDIVALYFSRPSTAVKDDITIGAKGSTHFTSAEVAAVNHFKNAMNGQKDYYTTGSNCSVICREQGAIVVAGSGSNMTVTVPNGGGTTAPGTYKDEITGSTWTVTATEMTGQIGSSGIAVIYNPDDVVSGASVSATPGDSSFTTNTLDVKLTVKNASSASYTTSEGDSGSFTDSKTITIGSKTNVGGKVTVTVKATGDDNKEVSKTFTYVKTDPSQVTAIYFDNSSYNWSNVYAYVYVEGTTTNQMAAWPGVQMTKDSATGYYKLELDDTFENGLVIFSDGTGSASNRYPADMQPGLAIDGTSKLFSANNKWETYVPVIDTDSDTESDTDSDTETDSDTDSDEPTVKVLLGDATQDGKVSLRDASLVQRTVAKLESLSGNAKLAADVDDDGKLTSVDYMAIQAYDIQLDTGYDIGKKVEK